MNSAEALQEVFLRHERLAPDADEVLAAVQAEVVRRARRRRGGALAVTVAFVVVAVLLALTGPALLLGGLAGWARRHLLTRASDRPSISNRGSRRSCRASAAGGSASGGNGPRGAVAGR